MRRKKAQRVHIKNLAATRPVPLQLSQCFPFFEIKEENPTRAPWPEPKFIAAIRKANWSALAAGLNEPMPPGSMDPLKLLFYSQKSDIDDQTNVQMPAAIRRLKDSADNFQGGR